MKVRLFLIYFHYINYLSSVDIAHSRGNEVAAAWFGKRQTQMLTFVVWYAETVDGVIQVYQQLYLIPNIHY